jgi:hypothetical protein
VKDLLKPISWTNCQIFILPITMNLNGNLMFLLNSLEYLRIMRQRWSEIFKLKTGGSWEVTGEMDRLFQDLIEHQRENLLKLLVLNTSNWTLWNSPYCEIMRWKQCFSKWKMDIDGEKSREMHSEFQELKGWTDIYRQTMWVVEWVLLHLWN